MTTHETEPSISIASPSRPLSFVPPPSPFPLSKSGARQHGKQATPTPDDANRRHLRLISSEHLRTDWQGSKQSHGQPEQARDAAHRRRPRRQASKTRHPTRHHASPLPVANRREARTGRDERHYPPNSRNEIGKQTNRQPPHRLLDETHGTRNGPTASPPQRDEERGDDAQ